MIEEYVRLARDALGSLKSISESGRLMEAWNKDLVPGVDGVWQANLTCRLCGHQDFLPGADFGGRAFMGHEVACKMVRCAACHLAQLSVITALDDAPESGSLDSQDEPVWWLREKAPPEGCYVRKELSGGLLYLPWLLKSGLEEDGVNLGRLLYFSLHSLERCLQAADWFLADAWLTGGDGRVLGWTAVTRQEEESGRLRALRQAEALMALDSEETWQFFRDRIKREKRGTQGDPAGRVGDGENLPGELRCEQASTPPVDGRNSDSMQECRNRL